jgi:hypothetical protein
MGPPCLEVEDEGESELMLMIAEIWIWSNGLLSSVASVVASVGQGERGSGGAWEGSILLIDNEEARVPSSETGEFFVAIKDQRDVDRNKAKGGRVGAWARCMGQF